MKYCPDRGGILTRCIERARTILRPSAIAGYFRTEPNELLVFAADQRWGNDRTLGGTATVDIYSESPIYTLTVAVFGPDGDCACFTDSILMYHIKKPTPKFFEDLYNLPCKLRGRTEGWNIYDETLAIEEVVTSPDEANEGCW